MQSDKETASDDDNIPSDFFDDLIKDDFINGLNIVDSWDDVDGKKRRSSRLNAETLDSVDDLRELIGDGNEDVPASKRSNKKYDNSLYKWTRKSPHIKDVVNTGDNLDDFIKPGSRRDPNKTKEAIKKDKEVKVKEYLAKQLDSTDDLCPPGTELDDFFDINSKEKLVRSEKICKLASQSPHHKRPRSKEHIQQRRNQSPNRTTRRRHCNSPPTRRRSPHHKSPKHNDSPYRKQKRLHSPSRSSYRRRSPVHRPSNYHSPYWRSPRRRSPRRSSRSPRGRSRSPRRSSRSPRRSSPYHRSRSKSRRTYASRISRSSSPRDSFLYPVNSPSFSSAQFYNVPGQPYAGPETNEFLGGTVIPPNYSYIQESAYPPTYCGTYEYPAQSIPPVTNIDTEYIPVPLQTPQPVPAPPLNPAIHTFPPAMVPSPIQTSNPINNPAQQTGPRTPYDALAQLVAEGKISKEDYLKLAPNKGTTSALDTKTRVMVLNRCHNALSKLGTMVLPNKLIINNCWPGKELKTILPSFCSPLKRQAAVEFHFTQPIQASELQNKHLVDSIMTSLGLEKVISKSKKVISKDMKDAAVQTTQPYCDVCEIRDSTKLYDTGTSTDSEYFTSTVHTQVIEQDLFNSKAVFNPSGSVGNSAPISIAHLTPAQLVSQLAARAKTLKKNDPPQGSSYDRRNPPSNYEYEGRGGGQYSNYNNYHY